MAQSCPTARPRRVAQYIRMSTEQQVYSPANQRAAILTYASTHGMEIVRTYDDLGRSGVALEGRDALQSLLADVQADRPGFDAVLVLDVSRWGRFQNADEAAYYEYLCLRHGVRVIYVAESFSDDMSPLSILVKGLKRSMAGEYSRELSQKVFAGQCRLVRAGFRMGGAPGYGLRRMLVDGQGRPKGILGPGERKALLSDHTQVVPGRPDEVRLLRWIFRQSAAGVPTNTICRLLKAKGLVNDHGRPFSQTSLQDILNDERYIGTMFFGRTTKAIGRKAGPTPERAIRIPDAFPAVVSPDLFWRAKAAREAINRKPSDEEMLAAMRGVWARHGHITSRLLNDDAGTLTAQAYMRRFGSLRAAYRAIGYVPVRDGSYGDLRDQMRPWRASIISFLADVLLDDGSVVERNGWTIRIDGVWTVGVRLLQAGLCHGRWRWEVRPGRCPVDILVAARMSPDGAYPLDYLVLPRTMADTWPAWITRRPAASVAFYTYSSLAVIRRLARLSQARCPHASS